MEILSNILYYVIPFIVLLGILVFVHEFGHFIVARMLGVKVVAFSIGFGKELWSHTDKKGTCWKISAVPLGGYCQFLGDADASSSTASKSLSKLSKKEKAMAFPLQKTWKKLAIVVAGPLFNYLLAVLIFIGIFFAYGKMIHPSVVGGVIDGSAAAEAGIMAGDEILSINGKPTPDFQTLSNEVMLSESDEADVEVKRPVSVSMQTEQITYCECGEEKTGQMIGVRSIPSERNEETGELAPVPVIIDEVFPNSPAERAGIVKGDVLESINGVELTYFDELKKYVEEHSGENLDIKGRRMLNLKVVLKDTDYNDEIGGKSKRRMLGVSSTPELAFSEKLSFIEAVKAGFEETYNITAMTLRGVWQMITGQRGGQDVGGIIRIAEMSGDVSKTGGIIGFIYFMALLSVNLGLINLFPIPVLDGGNIVIFLIEMVIGRDLKENVKDYIFKFGLLIILAIMLLATWNDILHLASRWFY